MAKTLLSRPTTRIPFRPESSGLTPSVSSRCDWLIEFELSTMNRTLSGGVSIPGVRIISSRGVTAHVFVMVAVFPARSTAVTTKLPLLPVAVLERTAVTGALVLAGSAPYVVEVDATPDSVSVTA